MTEDDYCSVRGQYEVFDFCVAKIFIIKLKVHTVSYTTRPSTNRNSVKSSDYIGALPTIFNNTKRIDVAIVGRCGIFQHKRRPDSSITSFLTAAK